jgi:fumarate hydratase subunit alpha/L(+)-tartrate dehydratase alpha subunit
MLPPADGIKGIVNFVIESVIAGVNKACPPAIVGVGIGGTFDECAWLAKKAATVRRIDSPNPNPKIRAMEEKLLKAINETGIGPMGLGGKTTALAVNIEVADTHISQLPVAINTQCWKGQRAEALINDRLEVEYHI